MKRISSFLILFCLVSSIGFVNAQQVIVTDAADYVIPATGAVLDVNSTTKGFVVPRMTTAQRTTLGNTTPVNGVVVYDIDLKSFWYWETDEWFQIAASGLNLSGIKFGDASNYATFEADGTLLLVGGAKVWDDIMIPGFTTKSKTNEPLFEVFIGNTMINYFLDAAVNSENQVYFTIQIPHSWAGTDIYPHVHYSPETSPESTEVVRWGLEYTWAEYNPTTPVAFPTTTIIYATGDVPAGSAKKHLLKSFGPIAPNSDQDAISSMLVCRLFRNSSNAIDTYTGRVGFLQFDVHFEKNTEGSRSEFVK